MTFAKFFDPFLVIGSGTLPQPVSTIICLWANSPSHCGCGRHIYRCTGTWTGTCRHLSRLRSHRRLAHDLPERPHVPRDRHSMPLREEIQIRTAGRHAKYFVIINLQGAKIYRFQKYLHKYKNLQKGGIQVAWDWVKNGVLFTFCRQENATFSPHFHTTWGPPFRDSLYNLLPTLFQLTRASSVLMVTQFPPCRCNEIMRCGIEHTDNMIGTRSSPHYQEKLRPISSWNCCMQWWSFALQSP